LKNEAPHQAGVLRTPRLKRLGLGFDVGDPQPRSPVLDGGGPRPAPVRCGRAIGERYQRRGMPAPLV
jgi:hypothetical protein